MKRRCAATLLASAMLAGLAGAAAPARAADEPTIPIIVKDTTSFYWQIVLAGARAAGHDLHVKVPELGATSEADINGQISILENAVADKPAAIVISPTQFTALGKPIDAAAKSVKIIGIDSAADSQAFTSFLTTDNVQGGRAAADAMAKGIASKNGGKIEADVALLTNLPGVGSLDQRAKGFKEELAKYPGLHLAAERIGDGQATSGLNATTDLLTANPDLKGVFASNLIQAQGAGQAIAENKAQGTVTLVGFDNDDKLVKLLGDGVIYALIVQDPYRMGYDGIKTALAVSKGQDVPKFVDTGVNTITKENMNTPRSQELLNPKVK